MEKAMQNIENWVVWDKITVVTASFDQSHKTANYPSVITKPSTSMIFFVFIIYL